jgi:hypothetical protein
MPTLADNRPAYRPDRLRRAWQLVKGGMVKPLGPGQYKVAGNVEPVYYVDLAGDPPCMCRDQEYRGSAIKQQCKHTLAARIAAQDPAVLLALIEFMEFKESAA